MCDHSAFHICRQLCEVLAAAGIVKRLVPLAANEGGPWGAPRNSPQERRLLMCAHGAFRLCRQLYEVLAAAGVAKRRLPVLLAANKADHGARAHTPDFVRRRLERELCVSWSRV